MKNQERTDRYLNNEMSSQERSAFTKELQTDAELRAEVRFQQDLFDFIEEEKPDLEKKLDNLGDKYFSTDKQSNGLKMWAVLLFAALVISIGLWLFGGQKSVPSPNKTQPSSAASSENIKKEKNTESEVIDSEIENIKQPTKEKNLPIELPDKGFYPKEKNSAPIAFYDINPDLESLLRENVRNTSVTVLNAPEHEAVLSASADLFTVTGETNVLPPYQLTIYSNRKFDFENDYPVLQKEVAGIKNDSEDFEFNFAAKAKFSPGLYYLLLQDKNAELMHISKFIVK